MEPASATAHLVDRQAPAELRPQVARQQPVEELRRAVPLLRAARLQREAPHQRAALRRPVPELARSRRLGLQAAPPTLITA